MRLRLLYSSGNATGSTDIRQIKGIGNYRAKRLQRLGVHSIRDLIFFFPRDYEDRSVIKPIISLTDGESACVRAFVADHPKLSHIRDGLDLLKFRISDDTAAAEVTFFNQSYFKDTIKQGHYYIFYGKFSRSGTYFKLPNPVCEPDSGISLKTGRIIPIYKLTAGITQALIASSVRQALDAATQLPQLLPELIPPDIRNKYDLCPADFAYNAIHFPPDFHALSLARRRLVFEEFFVLSCALCRMKLNAAARTALPVSYYPPDDFIEQLPFSPTHAQLRAISDVFADMSSPFAMNRLIQGDVGSGKTVVAAAAIFLAHKSGFQSAFMAPTELLAEQHFATLSSLLAPFDIKPLLLTGSTPTRLKTAARSAMENGTAALVVGTHALISNNIRFNALALAITDEQHRFGVHQRAALSDKGSNPHVLVMSATPIPRTLALVLYADLNVSIIDQLPPGRLPVNTYLVSEDKRMRVMNFIRKLITQGRQVYIVCPLIDDNEDSGLKAASQYAQKLRSDFFPDLNILTLHGKMKSSEKDSVMSQFYAGDAHILVSTTVIEVGVDVPNAALILIENAERFGLSQLHQLRGRVGRGTHESFCILFSDSKSADTLKRLKTLCNSSDGFRISEEDLRIRGPGDFFGSRQHGLPELKIADPSCDLPLLSAAQTAAADLLVSDPLLSNPALAPLKSRIDDLFGISLF